jgi:phospholipid/cholesterol/gamma-HCH transport system substrate-binding protein
METRARYLVTGLFTVVAVILLAAFVIWMQSASSTGARRNVMIEFHGATPGLQTGAPVVFNGLRIGQVTRVSFDTRQPGVVDALVSVDPNAPLSEDTRVTLESQGLLGSSTFVSLGGGRADRPLVDKEGEAYPVLSAPGSQTLTQAAQKALGQINAVLEQNEQPLHDIVANIQTFAAMLGRNSPKMEDILTGLAKLAGSASANPPPTPTFDLTVPSSFPGLSPPAKTQLVVPDPTAVVTLETQRFLSRTPTGQIAIESAQWTDSIPKLLQKKILAALDSAGFRYANPPTDGLNPDYQLHIDVRAFAVVKSEPMRAQAQFEARLQDRSGAIVDSALIDGAAPASGVDGPAAAQAMDAAFADAARKMLPWVMTAVAAAERHPAPAKADALAPPPPLAPNP